MNTLGTSPGKGNGGRRRINSASNLDQSIIEALDLMLAPSHLGGSDSFPGVKSQLETLKTRYTKRIVRIGVVGVTSSGKSTFLNNVLGRLFLPTGVPPSSGLQIVCKYDSKTCAKVIFSDSSNRKELLIASNIKGVLSHYGDERFNQKNHLHVSEIQCFSSCWRLPEDYVLVDTPGLGAYGHEEHEEITLRMVVPTVDVILYLTTAKCESDERTLQYIDSVTTQEKPLIVVQNKIDSIEGKLSRDARENKSRSQVQAEHLERVRKMLGKAQKESVRNAPVVQISAKNKEGIDLLLKTLVEQVELNSAGRNWLFASQLVRTLEELLQSVSISLSEGQEKKDQIRRLKVRIDRFADHRDGISRFRDSFHSKMDSMSKKAEILAGSLLRSLSEKYQLHQETWNDQVLRRYPLIGFTKSSTRIPNEIKRAKEELQAGLKVLTQSFNQAIQDSAEMLKKAASDLNLQESQLYQGFLSETAPNSIISDAEEDHVIHHKARREEQDGAWGLIKRVFTFGICGYDYYPAWDEQTTRFSADMLCAEIGKAAGNTFSFLQKMLPKYLSSLDNAINVISERIREMNEDVGRLENTSKKIPEDLLNRLKKDGEAAISRLSERYHGDIPVLNVQQPDQKAFTKDEWKEIQCNPLACRLYEYAWNSGFQVNRAWIDFLIKKAAVPTPRLLLAGWNSTDLDKLEQNYFSGVGTNKHGKGSRLEYDTVNLAKSKLDFGTDYNVIFVLLEISESGFSEQLFVDTGFREYLRQKKNASIVWCMNSAGKLKGSRAGASHELVEALNELVRISKTVLGEKQPFAFMSNDHDILYTLLLHGLYFELPQTNVTEQDRRDFIQRYAKTFRLSLTLQNQLGTILGDYITNRKK